MANLELGQLQNFLKENFSARLLGVGEIGSLDEQGMKDFGYGKPLLVRYEKDGKEKQAVLSMMNGDRYGHQFYWDRAAILMFQHEAGKRMPRHVKSLALGFMDTDGILHSVEKPQEFFCISEKVDGYDYFLDLDRIKKGDFRPSDLELAEKFAIWLAEVHSRKLKDPDLYWRSVRQLLGASECIWGLIDTYPHPYEFFPPQRFQNLEKRLIDWRWKLRDYAYRLSATHGDFHPWNVLVQGGGEFAVLDISRGEWGEPADDVATMSCNYLLFGLYDKPLLEGPFAELFSVFWETYLKKTGDVEMLKVVAPYFVFRGLVIASPEWYPSHPEAVRKGLFRFLENVLVDDEFDYKNVNKYMK